MKKTMWIIGVAVLWSCSVGSQIIFEEPLSPRNANYKMEVRLDVETKRVLGREILTWRNISEDVVRELQFHLYMNAFKNNRSTFMRERRGRAGLLERENGWGWIDVKAVRIIDGPDLTDRTAFIHPDDDNEDDQTVMQVLLPESVRPGREVRVEIEFVTQLPRAYRRNGYYKDFFMVAQWFPKIGVYIDGAWNCHQFHRNTEFFADYGVYDVEITVPREYIVGATGLVQKTVETDSTKVLSFRAEDVHDFVWTAWPHFKVARENHRNVEITLLYDEDHESSVSRYMNAAKHSLDFMAAWVGEYPYPNLTILDAPTGCWFRVGGMEYMTFITVHTFWHFPRGFRWPEMVTVHEFCHNYWYGMVGSNEFEEAWLDEGINTYTEVKIMDRYYDSETSYADFMGIRLSELVSERSSYIRSTRRDRILREAWTYIGEGWDPGTFSYNKPCLMLLTLENLLGQETMDAVMRTYFQRWQFKHPHTQDFIDVVNEVAGESYDWYFDQVLRGSNELDYAVASVRTGKEREPKGVFDDVSGEAVPSAVGDSVETEPAQVETEAPFLSVVKVQRRGEVVIPVDVLMVFEDGDSVRRVWDGRDRWAEYRFLKPARLVHAEVDPDRKLVLDSNFSNNSRTVKPQRKPVTYLCTRFLYWFETALHLMSFFG